MKNKYSFSEFVKNIYYLILTKLFFSGARLIRRPIYIRGRTSLEGGKGLTTGRFCRFDLDGNRKTLHIGENCQFGDFTHIVAHESVTIGDNVLLASKVFISDTSHGRYKGENQSNPSQKPVDRDLDTKAVTIGNNVWIGENVVILPGCRIGSGCIVGANSVVTKSIKDKSIAVGSPAIVIKSWDESENKWKYEK